MKKKLKIGIGMLAILAVPTLAVVSCGNKTNNPPEKKVVPLKDRIDKLTTLSSNHKNILLFFNDEVTGDTAYEMLKKRKDIQNNLSEFTIYKNTVSAQFTNFGIPAIVGGWDYTLKNQDIGTLKDKTNWESIKSAYKNSMNMFSKAGYSQQWHSMQYADKKHDDDAHHDEVQKNFPNQKYLTATYTTEINKFYKSYNEKDNWNANALRSALEIKKHLRKQKTERPLFKFFGNEATHTSFAALDKKTGQPISGVTSDEATIFSLEYMGEIEQKIKNMGKDVWDNTMIIYASDHGSARQEYGLTSNNSKEMHNLNDMMARWDNNWAMNPKYNTDDIYLTRMNPTLMIKPFKDRSKSSSPLKFDDKTLLSNRDIPTIIRNAIKSYDPNFNYGVVDKNGTDFSSFRQYPLKQSGDRTISMYPVEIEQWSPEYDKRSHSHTNTQIRVTNDFYKRENWEWSDYEKTHWEKMWDPKTP